MLKLLMLIFIEIINYLRCNTPIIENGNLIVANHTNDFELNSCKQY